MFINDELIFDFSINMPRILVGGRTGIIDHVKQILLIDGDNVVVRCGAQYISITGKDLLVRQLSEERMLVTGDLERIEFYGTKEPDQ